MTNDQAEERSKTDRWGRLRNRTIAFRLSEAEYSAVEQRARFCGYRWKQDYIIDAILQNKVKATANPLMLVQFRQQLRTISEKLDESSLTDAERDEVRISVSIMREILEAFANERNLDGERR